MAKKKLSNSKIDNLLDAAGKSKVVKKTSQRESKIQNSNRKDLSIKILSSEIREDDEIIYELAKIRIDSIDGKRETIASAIDLRANNENHVISIPTMVSLDNEDEKNITQATPTYSIDAKFNYISQDYDDLQVSIDEWNLNSFLDECSKDEILNFKKRKKAKITNFSRGNKMRNFIIPQNVSPKFKSDAPYYIRIALNDSVRGDLSKFLQKIGIYDEILSTYLASEKTQKEFNIQDGQSVTEEMPIDVYEINRFFDADVEIDLDNFYGTNQGSSASKMSYDLRKHLLKGYLKNTTKNGFRTFEEIHNGVECRRDALCYSVEKFNQFEVESARVQNLFAPAGDVSSVILDTQVKYGTTYVYKVTGHYMIVGNSYSYDNLRFYEEDGVTFATAEVTNNPSITLMPQSLFTVDKTIIQPPPIAPQVTFKTENNSTKEIQIYLSPTKTEVEEPFVEVIDSDRQQFIEMTNFYSSVGNKFKFLTGTQSGLFEIFRTTQPPETILSFSDKKLSEIRMSFLSTDAIYKDYIESNKDYYYMFRQVNDKGLVSNPTTVFKARLVVDADDARVILDSYEFPKRIMSESRREFKSMLQIKPATEQILFNDQQDALFEKKTVSGTLDNLRLGFTQHTVWGRKIKLRIKSKTSGKMIDLNINFELTKNKSKEEF
jgi:hypothetical protein